MVGNITPIKKAFSWFSVSTGAPLRGWQSKLIHGLGYLQH